MLASDSTDTETLQALNRELQVIEFQQNIPIEALEVSWLPRFSQNVVLPELKLAEHVGYSQPCHSQEYKYWKAGWLGALSFPGVLQVMEHWVAGYSLFSFAGKWSGS